MTTSLKCSPDWESQLHEPHSLSSSPQVVTAYTQLCSVCSDLVAARSVAPCVYASPPKLRAGVVLATHRPAYYSPSGISSLISHVHDCNQAFTSIVQYHILLTGGYFSDRHNVIGHRGPLEQFSQGVMPNDQSDSCRSKSSPAHTDKHSSARAFMHHLSLYEWWSRRRTAMNPSARI